jgi:hypothetical protein
MLFAEPLSPGELSVRESPERQALVQSLLEDFRQTFPTIEFSLISEFGFLNAQALLLGSKRLVKLYGGLAFHNRLGKDALAFALLHETGHHLAVGSRLNWNPWLACECVSDLWAVNEGAATLREQTGYTVNIVKAVEELDQVIGQPTELEHSHACWAFSWRDRKASILKEGPQRSNEECPLGELMMRATSARHFDCGGQRSRV